ncbi:type IX secretion system membrane protein, PorP/SprF family [Chitinophaga costaii]|uniref:Type IX secretion system membrane protein, PorP/SprF family n=1 Tax=Chitinophaga costaii TaxID=1335309 RepID=A0A1C4AY95_9BACT|nr:PorP/SprF family type IX secretion system membrane protein [Chitinophaga costaii]PUZ26801.1 type IX secretion system membrane protein PorP/SprF [Chitinophaga costaii]SCB99600.1 type IX secretion system membrane protein, PorP/SprF family [Chitinophaga costaii]
MKNLFVVMLLAVGLIAPRLVHAQVDPHFSQYYAYPLWLNPALTGVIDGDYRATVNYRNQWASVGQPYSTAGFSLDAATGKNIGVGVKVLNMSAGEAGFNYFNAMASFSYSGVKFGTNLHQHIVFGLQGGLTSRKVDPTKFQTGMQYSPGLGFDPSLYSGESLTNTHSLNFDAAVGILYYDGNPDHTLNPFAGFSVNHVTQPDDHFLTSSEGKNKSLPARYLGHGGLRIKVDDRFSLTPHFMYLKQGTAEEKLVGLYGQYKVNPEFYMLAGCSVRFQDAVIPFAGFHFKNAVLGLSYDVTTSRLNRLTNGVNTFEVSLSYICRKKKVMPEEHFFCPRL